MATATEHRVLGGHLTLSLVSPEGTLFEGAADMVVAPGADGEVAFLPGHAPYVGLLGVGELRFHLPGGGTRLHTQATVNGLRVESYYGLYAREPWIFQVIGFTGQRQFASVEAELASLIASFEGPAT